jgi:gluconate kinase
MRSETSKAENIQHIWVVTGPAGCGKSTVGRILQKELGLPFLEGDDVSTSHPPDILSTAICKMRKSN